MVIDVIKHTIMITSFVLAMMLLIEFINVQSHGNWMKNMQKSTWFQLFISALLGLIPGCLGTFSVVSLYTHNIVNFAALVAAMIASSGDEAFFMFSMFPKQAIFIQILLFVIAFVVGIIINLFYKKKYKGQLNDYKFPIHKQYCPAIDWKIVVPQLKKISFQRTLLISGLSLFIFLLIIGKIDDDHHHDIQTNTEQIHHHELEDDHEHLTNEQHNITEGMIGETGWGWQKITFLALALIALCLVIFTHEHFLQEHLWEHVIKKHFLKVFLWTFAALLFIAILNKYIDVDEWISSNHLTILIIAVLIGVIPESGPHMVFVTLFSTGAIPLSILLANSIVQDGHGAIPLFAESKKDFLKAKLINILVGLIIGFSGLFIGW